MNDLATAGAPWWVIGILVVFGVVVPTGTSQRAATIPGLLGSAARWWQDRKDRRRREAVAEARAAAEPSPSALIADREIERLKAFYKGLADDCAEEARRSRAVSQALTERVEKLEDRVTAVSRKFFVLLGHYRKSVDRLQRGEPLPEPPEELRQYLP
ncbi:hypothetical protein [Gordonia sp. SND2]|uniref:hypothetical protein n=1 Tax=Gordonia sp. SND2 TaxID=3388659 RepID=UPI00398BAEF5